MRAVTVCGEPAEIELKLAEAGVTRRPKREAYSGLAKFCVCRRT